MHWGFFVCGGGRLDLRKADQGSAIALSLTGDGNRGAI